MSLLTSYGTNNRVIECGKTKRITCSPVGDPVVTVYKGSDGKAETSVDTWYKATCVCSATYSYVGMDYETASACAQAMISKFTRSKTIWEYGVDQERTTEGVFYFGWHEKTSGTVQEAQITLSHDEGRMYSVRVQAQTTDEKYLKNGAVPTFEYPSCFSDVP